MTNSRPLGQMDQFTGRYVKIAPSSFGRMWFLGGVVENGRQVTPTMKEPKTTAA
ncbi:MAG: hypothetical protein KAV00_15115 [Phycisphaerae bacterium]|nr:hypothetical protein [Phycisphaerae bacterium]